MVFPRSSKLSSRYFPRQFNKQKTELILSINCICEFSSNFPAENKLHLFLFTIESEKVFFEREIAIFHPK